MTQRAVSGQSPVLELDESARFAAIGRLTPGIAHEINTPVQYIGDNLRFLAQAFAELSAAFTSSDAVEDADVAFVLGEAPKAIAQSLDGIAQLARVAEAMRRMATARAGQSALIDLNATIESVLTICRNEWKCAAELELALDPALPLVACGEAELSIALLHLITDRIEAQRRSRGTHGELGVIHIATRTSGADVELALSARLHSTRGASSLAEGGSPPAHGCRREIVRRLLAPYDVMLDVPTTGAVEDAVLLRFPMTYSTLWSDA